MKAIYSASLIVALLCFINAYSQTAQEAKDWIKSKIDLYGSRGGYMSGYEVNVDCYVECDRTYNIKVLHKAKEFIKEYLFNLRDMSYVYVSGWNGLNISADGNKIKYNFYRIKEPESQSATDQLLSVIFDTKKKSTGYEGFDLVKTETTSSVYLKIDYDSESNLVERLEKALEVVVAENKKSRVVEPF